MEKSKPFVSLIVLNWNGEEVIGACLTSLINQTYPNYEIIVVDNASVDSSREIIKKEFPNVKLIMNEKNLGFKGNNAGIQASKGELIVLVNNDIVAKNNWLFELVKVANESTRVGIVGGPIYYYKPKDIIWASGGKFDFLTGISWHVNQGKRMVASSIESIEDIDYVPGAAILIKREVIEKIGLIDEDYFVYCDDLDWCINAQKSGYECKLVGSAITWHMVSFTLSKNMIFSYYHNMRSSFHLYLKHLPIPFILTAIFFQYVFSLFEVFFFKRPIDYMIAKNHALAWNLNISCIRKVMRERKTIKNLEKRKFIKIRARELLDLTKERLRTKIYYS